MLALRSRGLGSAWTTLHLIGDGEKQAAELLGIPYEQYTRAGCSRWPTPRGTSFKPANRLPADQLTHWDSWWSDASGEPVLPPRLVGGDRGGIGQVQRSPAGQHGDAHLFGDVRVGQRRVVQPGGFPGTEQQDVTAQVAMSAKERPARAVNANTRAGDRRPRRFQ